MNEVIKRPQESSLYIVFGLRAFERLSGTNVVTFYADTIFKEAGSVVPSSISTIVYFSVQLMVSIVASFLVDKLGRKPLLIWSIIGSGAVLAMEAVYVYLDDYTDVDMSHLKCVPLVALIGYVTVFNIRMGTIPVLMLGEMFPTSEKAVALGLADISFGIIVTIISKSFQFTKDSMGLHVPFFVFTASCVLGLMFIIIWVPETKGKTLEEIEHELNGGRKKSGKMSEVIKNVRVNKANVGKFWQLFTIKGHRKAVFIVFGLRALQQLSGTNFITFYAGTISKEAGCDVSSSISTIVYFSAQLVVPRVALFLVDKLGRKPLLI
nr:unnamed protein product [Callosobruchus analis]